MDDRVCCIGMSVCTLQAILTNMRAAVDQDRLRLRGQQGRLRQEPQRHADYTRVARGGPILWSAHFSSKEGAEVSRDVRTYTYRVGDFS